MAGEGRLDGDLRRLLVSDLADHDDVGVLAENRAQRAREVEADLALHLHLLDAGLTILDGVLDGDDILAGRLDELERGVEGGGLAAARGNGDEHHAPGTPHALQEHLELLLLEAEVLDAVALHHRRFLEEPEHDLLAIEGGEGGDAEDHGEVELARDLEEIEEETVDAVPDARAVVVGLHVDIGGAVEGRAAQEVVDHAHHGRVVRLRLQLLDVDHALGRARDGTDVEAEVDLESVVEALGGHDLGDLAVRLLDRLLDGAGRPDAEIDLEAGGAPEVVHGHDVQRVGSGDDEPPARALRRDHPVLPGHFFGHELDDVGVEGGQVLTGDGVFAKLRAEVLEQDVLVDQLHVDEDLTQPLSGLALPLEGLVELLGG